VRQVSILLGLALLLVTPAMAQAPADAPAQTPADAPAQTPADAPAQAPADAPAQTPAQAPPADTSAQAPAKKPTPPAAQAPAQPRRSRLDLSLGYTYANYDQQDEPRLNMSGFNLGADVNLLKWLQVGANLTGDYNRESSSNPGLNGTKTSLVTFMIAPRIYFRGRHHQRSYFFDGLVGLGDIGVRPPYLPPLPQTTDRDKVLAWGVGFGVDYALSPRFAIRPEADFVRTGFFGGNPGQSNAVASVSLVYHPPQLKAPPKPKKRKKKQS
jgi:opacity protein-like surface antigen